MSIVKQRKVLESALEPADKNWLWLHTKNGERVLEEFINGKWTVVSGTSKALEDAVTRTELDRSISAARTSITEALMDYVDQHGGGGGTTPPEVTKKDLNDLIDTVNGSIDTLSTNIKGLLAGKQDKLSAGDGIKISESNEISCTISGGGGGGTSVAVVEEESEADDNNTLYFFVNSPLQGVGLYNILLRDGSIVGRDGVTYNYSPRVLYHLYPDGSFDVLENDNNHFTTVDGNSVFYNFIDNGEIKSVRTSMCNVGRIIVPHRTNYADTSDTAYFCLQIEGPFFSEYTDVELHYDEIKLSIMAVTDIETFYPPESINNIKYCIPRLEPLHNGHIFRFTNNDYFKPKAFLVIRKSVTNDGVVDYMQFLEPLDSTVTFSTSAEVVDVLFRFSPTKLLYKDGVVNPMPSSINSSNLEDFLNSSAYFAGKLEHKEVSGSLSGKAFCMIGTGDFSLLTNVQIDQTKRNILYVKTAGNNIPSNLVLKANRNGWVNNKGNSIPYYTVSENPINFMLHPMMYGVYVSNCVMHDTNPMPGDNNISFALENIISLDDVRFGISQNNCYFVTEIGLMTYLSPKDVREI